MSNPLVSIVMPIYNGEMYLSIAIESVLNQTHKNLELILINDGSTDNSHIISSSYLNDKRVRYYKQKNSGVSAARNFAINKSNGDYIAFLDQDDFWEPNKLEVQVNILLSHSEIALTYSDYTIIYESSNTSKRLSEIASFDTKCCELNSLFERNRIGVLTVLVRKTCLTAVGPLNEDLNGTDDYELWLRLALKYQFLYYPSSLACYRWHDNNVSSNELNMMIEESKALDSFLLSSDAYNALGSKIIRTRLFNIYFKCANLLIWLRKDMLNARKFYFKALKQRQSILKVIPKLLSTYINPELSKFISWQLKKLALSSK